MSIDISDSGSASGSSFVDDGGPQFMGAGAAWGGMPDAADPYAIPLAAPSTRTFTRPTCARIRPREMAWSQLEDRRLGPQLGGEPVVGWPPVAVQGA